MKPGLILPFEEQIIRRGLRIMLIGLETLLRKLPIKAKRSNLRQNIIVDGNRMFPNYDPAVLEVGVEVEKVVRTNLLEGDAGGAVGQKAF